MSKQEAEPVLSVKLSSSDWLKIIGCIFTYGIITLIWAVRIDTRVSNLEAGHVRIHTITETVTRIDERTKEIDRRMERMEKRSDITQN